MIPILLCVFLMGCASASEFIEVETRTELLEKDIKKYKNNLDERCNKFRTMYCARTWYSQAKKEHDGRT